MDNLELGDAIVQAQQRLRKGETATSVMERIAGERGITIDRARQCRWIAEKVPPEDPLRHLGLSFGHLRALAKLDPDGRLRWGRSAQEGRWSVRRLEEALRSRADWCPACGGRPEAGPAVSVQLLLAGEGPSPTEDGDPAPDDQATPLARLRRGCLVRCCGTGCAAGLLAELAAQRPAQV